MEGRICAFCTHTDEHRTQVLCNNEKFKFTFEPYGKVVLIGQEIKPGKFSVTINSDLSGDDIANLMAGMMDKISQFPHIQNDPSVIMKGIMGNLNG